MADLTEVNPENLRRSKRNKFHLDVATMHLIHPERRRGKNSPATSSSPSPRPTTDPSTVIPSSSHFSAISPIYNGPQRKKVKKEDEGVISQLSTSPKKRAHKCPKCPATFDALVSLRNHEVLHGGGKKLGCDRCDYTSASANAIKLHNEMHSREGSGLLLVAPSSDTPPILEVQHSITPLTLQPSSSIDKSDLTVKQSIDQPLSIDVDEGQEEPPNLQEEEEEEDKNSPHESFSPIHNVQGDNDAAKNSATCNGRYKCRICPFTTRDNERLERHSGGHNRTVGFMCPLCNFKSESAGFLKRHVDIHGVANYQWPPLYVGISPRRARDDKNGSEDPPTLIPVGKVLKAQHQAMASAAARAAAASSTVAVEENGEKEEKKEKRKRLENEYKCLHKGCKYTNRLSWRVVNHRRKEHKGKDRMDCTLCGRRVMKSIGARIVHLKKYHSELQFTRKEMVFYMEELMGKELIQVKKESTPIVNFEVKKEEVYEEYEEWKDDGPCCSTSTTIPPFTSSLAPSSISRLSSSSKNEQGIVSTKEFKCCECPYTATIKSRLDRHRAKHLVEEDNRCSHCSFSCRSLELLASHEKLHGVEEKEEDDKPPLLSIHLNTPKKNGLSDNEETAPSLEEGAGEEMEGERDSPPLLEKEIIRHERSEERKKKRIPKVVCCDGVVRVECDECPYLTKHLCDLRAHKQMHSGKRQLKCKHCTYSTKRPSSLQSHLNMHREAELGLGMYDGVRRDDSQSPRTSSPDGESSRDCLQDEDSKHGILLKETKKNETKVIIRHFGVIGVRRGNVGPSREYSCTQCPFRSSTISALWKHGRHHLYSPPLLHRCNDCSFSTSLSSILSSHSSLHISRSLFICDSCSFVGYTATCLVDHMEAAGHSLFTNNSNSSSRHSPSDDKNERCQSSRIAIRDKNGYSILFDLESSKKMMRPSKEERAAMKLAAEASSATHLQCPECPFSDPDPLVYRIHTGMHEGPKRAFECTVCSYSAYSPEGLHRHIGLHLPPDAPKRNSGRMPMRKRHSVEVIPSGVNAFECSQCSFRTLNATVFHEHKIEHAQHIQQRLVTQIKRAANSMDEERRGEKKKNKVKPSAGLRESKQLVCTVCTFRCDTVASYERHRELHGGNGIYHCSICNYAHHTKQVVDYHISHHHTDLPLTHLVKLAVLQPSMVKFSVSSTMEDKVRLAGQVFSCQECTREFLEMRLLLAHWEEDHSHRGDDVACHLSLGMLPTNRILTKA